MLKVWYKRSTGQLGTGRYEGTFTAVLKQSKLNSNCLMLNITGSPRRVSDVSSHVNSHSNSSQLLLVVPSASSELCSIYECLEQTQTR